MNYDKYYQTENLFGNPFPELIDFCRKIGTKGRLLDLGCGQGRDAIPLAQLGFIVTAVDHSKVGIDQMNRIARQENLDLQGTVGDIYAFDAFENFDLVLLDSMFHFSRTDKAKEIGLIQKIVSQLKRGSILVVCIQDTGNKVQILNKALDFDRPLRRLTDQKLIYRFEDRESGHRSVTDYRMIAVEI